MAHLRRSPLLPTLLAITMTLTACTAGGQGARHGDAAPGSVRHPDGTPWSGDGETVTRDDPRSTFGVDVDTASYGYARRLIMDGRLPERTAVRPEEFVNSFRQDYAEPGGDGFAVHADGARFPDTHEVSGDVRLMRVGLQTRSEDEQSRPDAALTFVVDVSGSMGSPDGSTSSRTRCTPSSTSCAAPTPSPSSSSAARPGWSGR